MEDNSQKENQVVLDKALHSIEFEGLSKDEKKAINAYEDTIHKGLAIFNGKPLTPVSKVSGDAMEETINELIKEDQETLMKEFKDGFRQILKDKIALDRVISEKQKEFNRAVVAEKKTFTQKANKVLSLVDNINKLKSSYMKALAVNVPEQVVVDNKEEDIEQED